MPGAPDFSVSVGGSDRTGVFKDRLLKLRLVDTTGKEADQLELEFDDRDSKIALPAHGAVISASIGYAGKSLTALGKFTVDETEIEGPPDTIRIRGKSSDMRASLKAHKTRHWRQMSVGAIVAQIAAEHNLQPGAHADLAGIQVDHRDQTNESDMHFVTRLGHEHDAIASAKSGKLVLAPRGKAVSASGKSLSPVALKRSDLTRWHMVHSDRAKHGKVRARHYDRTAAAMQYVEAGGEDPVKVVRHVHASAAVAGQVAHASHRRGKRKSHKIELELPGNEQLFAGRPVQVSGVRDGINGRWICSRVEHELDFASGGFTTKLEATVDGLDQDTGDGAQGYGGDDADNAAASGEGSE